MKTIIRLLFATRRSSVMMVAILVLLTVSFSCTRIEDEPMLTLETSYRLMLSFRSLQINDVLSENDDAGSEPLVRDPFHYLYLRGDPERTYVVATHAFPGAEVRGVFQGHTLTIDVEGQHVELTSHTPILGAAPVPAYVRVDKPLGKTYYGVFVSDRHDVDERLHERVRTWNDAKVRR